MKIKLHEITIGELVKNYMDNAEEGVFGYGGKLNIRPPYQREFIYDDKKRNAVIDSIKKKYPLNVMYWVKNDDGSFDLLDGQQRTVSICQYVSGVFSFDGIYFHNLLDDKQEKFRNYKLMIYWCEGSKSEVLDWFKIINIGSLELTQQELRNAIYQGPWVTDAKRHFSKTGCPAYQIGNRYLNGTAIRQDYLETVIKWMSENKIENYMGIHQHDPSANPLWLYFQEVINWIEATFPQYRKEMKGVDWGGLYKEFGKKKLDPKKLEDEIVELMADDDVTNKKGIYTYVLTGEERHLSIRAFTDSQKRTAFTKQKGKCPKCKKVFGIDQMEADHITPWSKGGKTAPENCQMLCKPCNRRKGNA